MRRAYAVQLHLHGSMSEGPASHLAHDHLAAETGAVDLIWWTDHDFRVANFAKLQRNALDSLAAVMEIPNRSGNAERPVEQVPLTWERVDVGGYPGASPTAGEGDLAVSPAAPAGGGGALRIALPPAEAGARLCRFELKAGAHYESFPLLTRPVVSLAVCPEDGPGEPAALVRLVLSQQPPDLGQPSLTYVAGDRAVFERVARGAAGSDGRPGADLVAVAAADGRRALIAGDAAFVHCPAEVGTWQRLALDPAADVERLGLRGGLDNALHRLQLGVASGGAGGGAGFAELEVAPGLAGPAVLDEQRALLARLPTRVKHLVGLEISYYGRHFNAFGSGVPIPDYAALLPQALTPEMVVEHIHRHGGLACLNHPPRVDVEGTAKLLAERRLFGADLIEVAHAGAGLSERLQLWDRLAGQGLVVTGLGVSDAHSAAAGWRATGRQPVHWVTHIWADSLAEGDLLAGLRRGQAFFADPAAFRGTIDLEGPLATSMGDVVVTSRPPRLVARLTGLQPGDLIAWLCNGRLVNATIADGDALAVEWQSPARVEGLQAIRVQVHRPAQVNHPNGGLVACSNPLYLAERPPETTHRVLTAER
jgi:antitoxin (DNA-binding transcriptional repressor) of toxin-antitoxin stability system